MNRWPFVLFALTILIAPQAMAQKPESVDLLSRVETQKHILRGKWESTNGSLNANAESGQGLCLVPYEIIGEYELTCEFTRQKGDDVVGIILPLGQTQVFLELGGWNGEVHGLSRIKKNSTKSEMNPTSVRPGQLKNNQRQRVVVRVQPINDKVSIQVNLNDKKLIDWTGPYEEAEPNLVYRLDNNTQIGLATSDSVTVFHKLTVTQPKGKARPSQTPAQTSNNKTDIDLTQVKWSETKGKIEVVEFQGEDVIRTQGEDDTVAFLPDVEMGDGTIEVDIASNIFSGIALRGADTNNYDLIYFRPQNSGTAKHDNTVQYVCKGRPGADWRTLRETSPGKYEAGAKMKIDEWFHVRIELKGKQLKTFVGDSQEPVLIVNPMLGERPRGKIGLWGWNSHFRNFSYRPSSKEGSSEN